MTAPLNVLILAAAQASMDTSARTAYPVCVTEVDGMPVLERIVNKLQGVPPQSVHYAFLADEVRRFHLDSLAQVLTPGARTILVQRGTKGPAATALMAAATMNPESELLMVSSSELVSGNLIGFVREMRERQCDAGTLVFRSVHPRHSYVRLDDDDLVTEAAQRHPISSHATAGVFWFRRTADAVQAIQNMIRKDAQVDGHFDLAPAFNELLLKNARIGVAHLDARHYQPINDDQQRARRDAVQSGDRA